MSGQKKTKDLSLHSVLRNDGKYRSFTICPANKFQFIGKLNRWGKAFDYLVKELKTYGGVLREIKIFPDLSAPPAIDTENNQFPRIHWHGWIKCDNLIQLYSSTLANFGGYRIEIDTIDDIKIWEKYCRKLIDEYPEYSQYVYEYARTDEVPQPQVGKVEPIDEFIEEILEEERVIRGKRGKPVRIKPKF